MSSQVQSTETPIASHNSETTLSSPAPTVCDMTLDSTNPLKEKLGPTTPPPVHQEPQTQFAELRLTPSAPPGPTLITTRTRDAGLEATIEEYEQVKLSQAKKWGLLGLFSLGFFVDIWSYSAFFIFTDKISEDLNIPFGSQTWVITAYAVTFSAFLLFWGRMSDLYSAKPVFSYGFLVLGILDLVISFLPDFYSFFVLRALSGIAGAGLIPASYRLITAVFEPHELNKAFTLFGMTGALANVTGLIIGGLIEFIPTHGQGAPWRWFFRILAILIIPFSIGSLRWIPKPKGAHAHVENKFKRLDLPGAFFMLSAIILLILGLTLGASYGFKTAKFLVPFLLAWALFAGFFVWEAKLPEDYAILPMSMWKIPNFALLIIFATYIYGWWATNFLPLVERYTVVYQEKPIIAAVRLLPQGLIAMAVTIILTFFPKLVSRPRWTITIGMLFAITGLVLFTRGNQIGEDYWKFIFTGGIIGSGGMMATFTGTNVAAITSVKPEVSGVAGAILQVAFQVGSAVALSIQAGLLTVNEGSISNYENVQTSFYFQIGWGILFLIAFLVFYRPGKKQVSSDADGAEQGEAKAAPIPTH